MATRIQVVIDCADPDDLATFWAEALGYKKQDPPEGYASGGTSRPHRAPPRTS
jgi:hypothetical protein